MEIERVCVPVTEVRQLWQFRVSSDPFAQGPIFILIGQCIVWMLIFCCFRCLSLFLQARHREERQQERIRDHQERSNTEQDLIKQMLRLDTSSTTSDQMSTSTASIPVSICVDNTYGVELFGGLSLKDALIRESDEEVTLLQTSAGLVAQTRVTRPRTILCAPPNPTESTCANDKRERFRMQLGRWHLIFRPSTENKGAKSMDLSTSEVPVILHSSYSGGILTVEGLHLAQATIQAATKEKCLILKTKYEKGPGELQVFTSESGLPSKNLAEVFVLASKNIVANGDELRVHSQAVRIRNDSVNTVLRSVIPFTILVFFATKQLAVSLKRIMETTISASVLAWLSPILLLVSTLILPRRAETIITVTLKKLAMRAYHTLYFAAQCFIPGRDPEVLSMIESLDSRLHGNHVVQSVPAPKIEDFEYQDGEQAKRDPNLKHSDREPVPSDEDFDVSNPEWEWPVYDTMRKKYTDDYTVRRMKDTDKKAKERVVPFSVVHKNLKALPWASQLVVKIYSAPLLEIIRVLMPDKVDQSATSKQKVELDRPELFQICEDLRKEETSAAEQEASGTSSSENTTKRLHLKHLLRFLDEDLKQSRLMHASMSRSERKVSWEMLWAFFPKGERVIYKDELTEENLCGDVLGTCYYQDFEKNELFFEVEVSKWDYNGKTWTSYSRELKVPTFNGEREILKLDIYPVQFTSNPAEVIDSIKKQGKKFCKLSMLERNSFMNYKGSMMRYNLVEQCYVLSKENADGRVMVDLGSFAKMNPDYIQLASANPPCDVIRDNMRVCKHDITEQETRLFAPAIVYGFSFRLKKWGCFSICGFSKIFFNTSAFDDLVMDPDTKEIVENLVRKQLDDGKVGGFDNRGRVDCISSKGEGSIILCYGPPGTGKTLTAESLAEKLRCPLWSLSVSELGITPDTLETMMVKVMDVSASWGAILLLDEADVFLERRTASSDLTRNAMTGIFLRHLEYYRGVLFLTTNRDSAFDDAMCSRISMFLHYERHSEDHRKQIWSKMLERVGLEVADEELAEFAMPKFNGREIRNIVKTAHTLARSKLGGNDQLQVDHVKRAFKVYEASTKIWGCDRDNIVIPAPERVLQDGWKKVTRTLSAGSLSSELS